VLGEGEGGRRAGVLAAAPAWLAGGEGGEVQPASPAATTAAITATARAGFAAVMASRLARKPQKVTH
jgi:hypothetical protein